MRVVEEEEFYTKADPAFIKVFNRDIDSNSVRSFSESMVSRAILYKTFVGNGIGEGIPMTAIVNAARSIGDRGCYLYRPYTNPFEPDLYYYPFDNPCPITEIDDSPPLSIYSENGLWGVTFDIVSEWGILGGTEIFVDLIRQRFPVLDKRVFSFLYSFYYECLSDNTIYHEQISGRIAMDIIHVHGRAKFDRMMKMSPQELYDNSDRDPDTMKYWGPEMPEYWHQPENSNKC